MPVQRMMRYIFLQQISGTEGPSSEKRKLHGQESFGERKAPGKKNSEGLSFGRSMTRSIRASETKSKSSWVQIQALFMLARTNTRHKLMVRQGNGDSNLPLRNQTAVRREVRYNPNSRCVTICPILTTCFRNLDLWSRL